MSTPDSQPPPNIGTPDPESAQRDQDVFDATVAQVPDDEWQRRIRALLAKDKAGAGGSPSGENGKAGA